jgi:hypothetical protein
MTMSLEPECLLRPETATGEAPESCRRMFRNRRSAVPIHVPIHKKPSMPEGHMPVPAVLVMGLGNVPGLLWEPIMSERNDGKDAAKPKTKAKQPEQPEKQDTPEGAKDQQGHQREPGYDEA